MSKNEYQEFHEMLKQLKTKENLDAAVGTAQMLFSDRNDLLIGNEIVLLTNH